LKNFDFLVDHYRQADGLFFSDALGSGMDNIKRYPEGWEDDGNGIPLHQLHPDIFDYNGLNPKWNRQGRSVDFSAQMVLFARQLIRIGNLVGKTKHEERLARIAAETSSAINAHRWSETDGCYYDLGYGDQIKRMHIGMFWTLWAGVAPRPRQTRLIAHLTDPARFWRTVPVASMPADSLDFEATGGYWRGGVWAPTNYMVLRGLEACGRSDLARRLALSYYSCVAEVYRRTATFWENYAPDAPTPGYPAKPDFCGWSALAPIALWHEYVV
jgi:glycogen debranching enzyme